MNAQVQTAAYTSPTEKLKVWVRDGCVLHLSFNNPAKHNAISVEVWQAVPALLEQAEKDDAIRVVVFSGQGMTAFASGADISQFEDMRAQREAVKNYETMAEKALMGLYAFSKPVIASIHGYCLGGGVNMAISCDIRLARSDSVFSIPATRLGLGYRFSALKNLVDLVGPGAAQDLFFTGRRIDAEEAKAIGLVNRVAPPEKFDELLMEYITAITTGAPLTIKAGKRIVREVLKPDDNVDMELCQKLIRDCFESEDYAEGRRAFMEKRKPVFKGK
jgi:enoyl-CoA hydratase